VQELRQQAIEGRFRKPSHMSEYCLGRDRPVSIETDSFWYASVETSLSRSRQPCLDLSRSRQWTETGLSRSVSVETVDRDRSVSVCLGRDSLVSTEPSALLPSVQLLYRTRFELFNYRIIKYINKIFNQIK